MSESNSEEVDAALRRAGLPRPPDDEYERLVQNWPYEREILARLRLPEVRYAEPAMIFRA
jgi:hypothetical protein